MVIAVPPPVCAAHAQLSHLLRPQRSCSCRWCSTLKTPAPLLRPRSTAQSRYAMSPTAVLLKHMKAACTSVLVLKHDNRALSGALCHTANRACVLCQTSMLHIIVQTFLGPTKRGQPCPQCGYSYATMCTMWIRLCDTPRHTHMPNAGGRVRRCGPSASRRPTSRWRAMRKGSTR